MSMCVLNWIHFKFCLCDDMRGVPVSMGGGTNLERKVLWGDQKWKIQLGGTWPIGGTLDYDGGTSNP